MSDILLKTNNYIFSYRVAGVIIQNNCILLQKPTNDDGYAFPGGHVEFGEANEQTLIREFDEEIGIKIKVQELKWVGEIFFLWGNKPCHQIFLYYDVILNGRKIIPLEGKFRGMEHTEDKNFFVEFYWIPLTEIGRIKLYPPNVVKYLENDDNLVKHFVYREE
jgi:ADP-ribose pyrophosphatase YjhB (NUDIX family)